MAWPTRSRVLCLHRENTPAANTQYSCGGPAAGHTWLVKGVTLYSSSGTARIFYLYLKRAGVSYCVARFDTAAVNVAEDGLTRVLEAGDEFMIECTTAPGSRIEFCAFGALLG